MEQTYKFKFLSSAINHALTPFAREGVSVSDLHNALQGRIRAESPGWSQETTTEKGKVKAIKQPKDKQKVTMADSGPTLTLGAGIKVAIPSTMLGQLVMLDAGYAAWEKHGVGFTAGINPTSYLASSLTKFAESLTPKPVNA